MDRLSNDEIAARIAALGQEPGDDMAGFYAYDMFVEADRGSDRGLMGVAVSVIDAALRDLLLSDPAPPTPARRALIAPGGMLDGRQSLLNHLRENSFFDQRTKDAAQALFDCDRDHFGYGRLARLDARAIEILAPFLHFTEDPAEADPARIFTPQDVRPAFEAAFNELSWTIITHIGNRERGLE